MADLSILNIVSGVYLSYSAALITYLLASAVGWLASVVMRGKGWYHIDIFSIFIIVTVTTLVLSMILKTIPGSNQILVMGGVVLHALVNPYFVATGGIAVTNNTSRVTKHRHYRYLNLMCLIFMAAGNMLVWYDGVHPPWALMLVVLVVLYLALVIPPRQAIITQQLFYGYKGVEK